MITLKLFLILIYLLSQNQFTTNTLEYQEEIGTIELIVLDKGTFSEIKYFTFNQGLITKVIFDSNGHSIGFDDYVGKKVSIIYEEYEGKIDWRGNRATGYKILSIELIK